MRLQEFLNMTAQEEDILEEADMQRIAAQTASNNWSAPMTAEEAIAFTMRLAGGVGNAGTDSSM